MADRHLATGKLVIDVRGVPELIADTRHELASLLLEAADSEAVPHTARRLREIAAVFETGQGEDLDAD